MRSDVEHIGQLADAPNYLITYMISDLFLKPRANDIHVYVYEQLSANDTQKQLNIINRWYATCAAEILTNSILSY